MGARKILQALALFLVFALAVPRVGTSAEPQQSAAKESRSTAPVVKTQTRLVTVDVVAVDEHGAPARGLQKQDFRIFEEHNREQQIAQFRFIERAPGSSPSAARPSATLFSNDFFSVASLTPTVLLMDALNTEIENQMQVRQRMLATLSTLPPRMPVAVFSLGHTLRVIENFSSDPGVLRAAIDRTLRNLPTETNPQNDADSPSNTARDLSGGEPTPATQSSNTAPNQNGGAETQAIQGLEDFEAINYETQMSIRVDETTDAMIQIAKYLGGYEGRKNLIWFSQAFPSWIEPHPDFGSNSFSGTAAYTDKIRSAAEALADAHVAVYPVDAQGLVTDALYSATQNPPINRQSPGRGYGDQLARQNSQLMNQQATMDAIADTTGGKTCKNANDLSRCVQKALDDGSAYYELAYYPAGVPWDGRFHKIVVKTTRRGVRLEYRRGYFATDLKQAPEARKPGDLFRQACATLLPPTSVALSVQPLAPQQSTGQAPLIPQTRYLVTVPTRGLTFGLSEGLRHLNFQVAVCEFDAKENTYQFLTVDLSRPVPDEVNRGWQEHGVQSILDYSAKPEDQRLRFVVLDVPSGETGAVDVPAHPREFASLAAAAIPEKGFLTAPPTRTVTTALIFRGTSDRASRLQWLSGTVTYQGNVSTAGGAAALFKMLGGDKYHCQSGTLVPNDPQSTTPLKPALLLEGADGKSLIVDMSGEELQYSGSLAMDETGKAFFQEVWKLCHCQQP